MGWAEGKGGGHREWNSLENAGQFPRCKEHLRKPGLLIEHIGPLLFGTPENGEPDNTRVTGSHLVTAMIPRTKGRKEAGGAVGKTDEGEFRVPCTGAASRRHSPCML